MTKYIVLAIIWVLILFLAIILVRAISFKPYPQPEMLPGDVTLNREKIITDLHKSKSESCLTEIGMAKAELRYMKNHLYRFMKPPVCLPDIAQMPGTAYTMSEPYDEWKDWLVRKILG